MALKATTPRFGTKARQRNAKRSPQQMYRYYERTYGVSTAMAWQRALSASNGNLAVAAAVLVPYRYSHRAA